MEDALVIQVEAFHTNFVWTLCYRLLNVGGWVKETAKTSKTY